MPPPLLYVGNLISRYLRMLIYLNLSCARRECDKILFSHAFPILNAVRHWCMFRGFDHAYYALRHEDIAAEDADGTLRKDDARSAIEVTAYMVARQWLSAVACNETLRVMFGCICVRMLSYHPMHPATLKHS